MNETWKDIPGYEGIYQVSDQGRVKSFLGSSKKKRKIIHFGKLETLGCNQRKGKIRKLFKKDGYLAVGLKGNGKSKKYRVHRLVYLTFNNMSLDFKGDYKSPTLVLHKNDDRCDNRLDNLFLGTQQDNINDMIQKGRYQQKKFIKYNQMIEDYKNTKNISESAKKFGVNYQTARKIINNHKKSCIF